MYGEHARQGCKHKKATLLKDGGKERQQARLSYIYYSTHFLVLIIYTSHIFILLIVSATDVA